MKYLMTLVLGSVLLLSACTPPQGDKIAVVDLQRVAKETGYSRQIDSHLESLRTDLQNQISNVQGKLNTQLANKQNKFGNKPSEQQRQELNQLFVSAKSQLQQAQQQAVDIIQKQRSDLADQLYDLLRPYAKHVANKHGMDIVLVKTKAFILDYSPKSDITDEVIAAVVDAKVDLGLKQTTPLSEKPVLNKPVNDQTDKNDSPSKDK